MRTRFAPHRLLAPLVMLLAVTGCGLHPLYENGTRGAVAQELAGVEVAPIASGKAGWLVRNAINDRLGALSKTAPRYRLTVTLDDRIEGLGIRANETVTREQRILRARFQLHDLNAPADAPPLLDQTARADMGLDVASSDYATVAAEDTALELLATQISDTILAKIAVKAAHRTRP